ncbi:hypothetical protein [Pseudoroseomonas cervicalis]|uniref:hypothetical protein n=1 Tax=Teichococcus cervicalis TaxID=204525 RepID=UPI0022F1B21B|nr:hypothetical protein [Pseudoroseomonas cervicalis]WBV44761.1 hypothetical protein PFY06_18505 [Pseudoroseomonas cervicalis]
MTLAAEVTFSREHVIAACEAAPGERLEFRLGDSLATSDPVAEGADRARVALPLAPLYAQAELPQALRLLGPDGAERQLLPPDALLSAIDIRTHREFFERVQSNTARMQDAEAVRFCARRLLRREKADFAVRCAALCVLGYRIVELTDPADGDLDELWAEAEATLLIPQEGEAAVRWRSSVSMMLTYIAILQRDADRSERMLGITLKYRNSLSRLLSPNYARSEVLLAAQRLAQGAKEEALDLLQDVETVFRAGVQGSSVELPGRGYYPYTEVQAALRVVRMAYQMRQRAERAADRKAMLLVAQDPGFKAMSSIMRLLVEGGHLAAWLQAAAEVPPGPPPLETAHRRFTVEARALQAQLWEAVAAGQHAAGAEAIPALERLAAQFDEAPPHSLLPWSGLAELARARFWCGVLLVRAGREEEAHAWFARASGWGKSLLARTGFGRDADFAPMNGFIAAVMMSYLAAHSQLRPVPNYANAARFTGHLLALARQVFGARTPQAETVAAFAAHCAERRQQPSLAASA